MKAAHPHGIQYVMVIEKKEQNVLSHRTDTHRTHESKHTQGEKEIWIERVERESRESERESQRPS